VKILTSYNAINDGMRKFTMRFIRWYRFNAPL